MSSKSQSQSQNEVMDTPETIANQVESKQETPGEAARRTLVESAKVAKATNADFTGMIQNRKAALHQADITGNDPIAAAMLAGLVEFSKQFTSENVVDILAELCGRIAAAVTVVNVPEIFAKPDAKKATSAKAMTGLQAVRISSEMVMSFAEYIGPESVAFLETAPDAIRAQMETALRAQYDEAFSGEKWSLYFVPYVITPDSYRINDGGESEFLGRDFWVGLRPNDSELFTPLTVEKKPKQTTK